MSDLRKQLRGKRQKLSSEDRQKKSLRILTHLTRYLPFVRGHSLGLYASTPEEVDTAPLLSLAHGMEKAIYLPVVNQSGFRKDPMLFARYLPDVTRLKQNRFGILEPDVPIGECIRAAELPLLCIPMVGFNQTCDRIGMGAGYYDRSLAIRGFRKPHLVGLAFVCQKANFEPATHDVPMNAVITEEGVLLRVKSGRHLR